ncbi:Fpg/Nei family DNA glycosylase [Evansella sp. AB-rgal1]|uniref:Fpg/Nei family DNA glycosylase n=1 Tax=Evansella sp. AB-rgal1 TaxID=3242696 RepID=UPI00359DAEE3
MPELPEMENYRRLLNEKIRGKTIINVEVTREKSVNLDVKRFREEVQGSKITGVERRAKYLIFKLDSGKNLLLHLMLGGLIYLDLGNDEIDRTKQVTLSFGNLNLFFIGLRLGFLHLLSNEELEKTLSELGPEPLDPSFSIQVFQQVIAKRRGVLKSTLVNQKFLAGIGNLYSDEICFEAKLLPKKKISDLVDEEKIELYKSIQSILLRGIILGGYMELPVFKGDKVTGRYNDNCYVYDREGESCHRCNGVIVRDKISSQKSFYCPLCQT